MRESRTPDELGKAYRVLAALVITIVFAGGATVAVRAAYGAFSDDFEVAGMFPRAGQSLRPGSDVKYRGVTVGKVRKIELVERKVKITLGLHKGTQVPASTRATVRPKTLFGEKYVELSYDPKAGPPYLAKGSTAPVHRHQRGGRGPGLRRGPPAAGDRHHRAGHADDRADRGGAGGGDQGRPPHHARRGGR